MFKLKKIASALASVVMIGSTIGLAAATTYPQPFVTNGMADVAIVYGDQLDNAAAVRVQSSLSGFVTSTGGTVITGESAGVTSSGDALYLNDELNEYGKVMYNDDLPTILADGEFTDDGGTTFDYDQSIVIGSGATFAFSDSDNDLTDPTLVLTLSRSEATPVYNLTVDFEAVNFTDAESEGETLMLFGKSYTVGTATDATKLVLLGGSDAETVNIGETKPLEAGSETYSVTVNGISDSTTPQASITINGETKTFTEGQTKSFADGDVDVFVKTVFRTGENNGFVEIQLGADKLTLETGKKVKKGADDTNVDGTLVGITGGTTAMTQLNIAVVADDSDEDALLVGEAFVDPVFGSFSVLFESVDNGPVFSTNTDTSADRDMLAIEKDGNRGLVISAVDASGDDATLPFTYQNATGDDSNTFHLVEGASLADEDWTILNQGNNQVAVQVEFSALTTGADDDDITLTNLFDTSETKTIEGNFTAGESFTFGSISLTAVQVDTTHISLRTTDYSTNLAVYPYIELVNGEDTRFAVTDYVTAFNDGTTSSNKTIELPTGSATVAFQDITAGDCNVIITPSAGGNAVTLNANRTTLAADEDTIQVGTAFYYVWANETGTDNDACTAVDVKIGMDATQDDTDGNWDAPGLLFVEDQDESDATATDKNAILLKTTDDGTYSEVVSTPVFAGHHASTGYDTDTFDDTDFTGYVTNYGTFVLIDGSDTNQAFASLTYPSEQMLANVFFVEADATSTPTTLLPVLDTDASMYAGKNLIVVGGSCVNTVAATLLGSSAPLCGADWESATGVSAGQYLIQTFDRSGKVATLVAGYTQDDTSTAVDALRTQTVDTTVGTKFTGSTQDNLVPVITAA